ncbi:extracellular solute-binding protein [Paenibacillus spongiae]|uniref:Extracellular solute-binding protein n=1 Tax=Paenibacillus spongiae TaxID=2909671 RepID=A0ABY5S0I2_9BACL|nr:extracellular solute-binding protein [Paenibacillus spongiae]UVI27351.1 extracellular solute-binding protein [Paenibacillus spongiae]
MRKRLGISLVVALFALMAVLSGCSSDDGGNGGKESGAAEGSGEKPKVLNLTVYNPIFSKSPLGTQVQEKWQEMMEEYLGVKLDITWEEAPFGDYNEKMPTYIAGGDFADVFGIADIGKVHDLGDSGQLLNLKDYMDQMPNYKKYLDSDPYGEKKVASTEGGIYGFVDGSEGNHNGTQAVFGVRFDILQKHDLKPPTTFDEMFTVAKKLKELYPDSYPLTNVYGGTAIIDHLLTMNHSGTGVFFNGEKFVYGPLADDGRFKGVIEYLHKFYAEGLLDPEYAINTGEQSIAKMLSGKNFITPFVYGLDLKEKLNNNAEHPEVVWGLIPHPKNLQGEVSWKIGSQKEGKVLSSWYSTVISAKTKNPELVVKMLDYQFSDEMVELANWGIEGVTFTKEGDKKTFKPEILQAASAMQELAKYGVNMSMSVRSGIQFIPQQKEAEIPLTQTVPAYVDGEYMDRNYWLYTDEANGKESISPGDSVNMPPLVFTEDEKLEMSSILTPMATFVEESITKFIAGKMPMDQWDKFVSDLKAMGDIDTVLKLYNDRYQEVKK